VSVSFFPFRLPLVAIITVALLTADALRSEAQIEVSNSIDLGYPIAINKYNQNLFYGQVDVGMRLGVSYKPNATQFYPTLDFAFGRTRLPLKQFENNVAYLNYDYDHLTLRGNFVMSVFYTNTLFLSMGIGADRLIEKGTGVSGTDAGRMLAHIDSTQNVDHYFPSISLGMEYVYGESVGQKVYLSVGFNFRYTIFFPERNTYYVYVRDAHANDLYLKGAIDGQALTPDFHITLHYMLGREVFFWQKKK